MPTTYAHWRFGCDCIETLPQDLQAAINNNRKLFDIGVHGPDIFFYDLAHKDVSRYGSRMHHEPARIFFDRCVEVFNSHDEDKEAMLAYILGFLSHYALDSQCHCYINTKSRNAGITHNKVEAEYDGHLMRQDGKKVNEVDRAVSLRPDRHTSRIIARFFPFDEKQIARTTRMQQLIISLFNCRSDFKRSILDKLLKKLGMLDHSDLIVYADELPICKDSNLRLDKLKAYALQIYPELASDLMAGIREGKELMAYYDNDFDPAADVNVPVLSYEQELQYIPEFKR